MARENERPARDNAGRRDGSDRNRSDRPNNDREGKKIFNRRDKNDRPEGGERGERRSFNPDRRDNDRRDNRGAEGRSYNNDRREGGERRSFGDKRESGERGERRSFGSDRREGGERRSFNSDRPRREDGERRNYGNDRREGGERRSFGGDRREGGENRERRPSEGNRVKRYDRANEGGERKSFNSDRPARRDDRGGERREGGDRRSFSSDRPRREDGEKRSFSNDRRESGERGERKSFGNDRREGSDRRSFNSDRPRREDGERRSFNNDRPKREDGERRSFSNDSPRREGGERRSFDGNKKPYRENREERLGKQAPSRDRFNDRKEGEDQEAPNYNLSRYKDNPRIKKTNRKEDEDGTIRLNRFIANAGVCSRREADSLIEAGEIKVNGEVITEMGYKVQLTDNVQYGKKILNREKLVYVLLNKPKDFITTTEDPEGRKTVMDLVANASKERIFPVGRLDRNTTGLLLFTNDGELAQKLTHPSNDIKKIYQVELDKPITKADFQKIAEGVELEDGKAVVDDVAILGESNHFLGIEIHIGRNRIVRRIFEHLGYDVVTLDRVQYAGLTKKDLPRGNWRFLSEKEVVRLKYFM
ncbi:23S rRNA pseudouridine2605 synthase [Pontibacter aydingkolensis]|uniref:Pseudouridine synthase n=1 Tax=Pontibacter aydingkolensis TaxID=1911536 RepID=A0ABS7CR10_9BACT|nr:pseudouridine synthase [Pontibacter aydingkolensis]MBW7466259.1 pseudouridine synthase [Pontibacter aydingkolensis]